MRRKLLHLPLLALALSFAGGCTTHTITQSSLVPAATLPPLPRTAPALMDLHVEDSTVTFVSRPKRAPNDDAALWITRHLVHGALSIHANRYVGLRLHALGGLHQGALEAAPTTLRPPGRMVTGGGPGIRLSLPLDGGRQVLQMTADVFLLRIPTRVHDVAVNHACEPVRRCVSHSRFTANEYVGQTALTIDYVIAFDDDVRVALRGGIRNHPTNDEVIENSTGTPEVRGGPHYFILGWAADLRLTEWLDLVPAVQWPMSTTPVRYGPIVSVGLRGVIPRPERSPW